MSAAIETFEMEVCPDCGLKQPSNTSEGDTCDGCGYTFHDSFELLDIGSHENLYQESMGKELPEINYITGDLFDSLKDAKDTIVFHITNVAGGMYGGFAKTVRELYPETNKYYEEACKEYSLNDPEFYEPMTFFTPEHFGLFANATIQTWESGTAGRNATYPDLVYAMTEVRDYCIDNNITEIWGPKFGGQLCGMNWDFIEELVKDIWLSVGLNVTIFVLPATKPISLESNRNNPF